MSILCHHKSSLFGKILLTRRQGGHQRSTPIRDAASVTNWKTRATTTRQKPRRRGRHEDSGSAAHTRADLEEAAKPKARIFAELEKGKEERQESTASRRGKIILKLCIKQGSETPWKVPAKRRGASSKVFMFSIGGRVIHPTDTAESLGLQDHSQIDISILSKDED